MRLGSAFPFEDEELWRPGADAGVFELRCPRCGEWQSATVRQDEAGFRREDGRPEYMDLTIHLHIHLHMSHVCKGFTARITYETGET